VTTRKAPLDTTQDDVAKIKKMALKALRGGDFDFALQAVRRGEANIPDMVEDLKIYQAELEVQNEELRDAQQHAEKAMRRFNALFTTLPLPTLEIDEFGVVSECNDKAEDFFDIDRSQLRSHFFPRLLAKHEQLRLREVIAQAKIDGNGSILEVQMQPVAGREVVADIYLSLLAIPDSKPITARFAVMVVDQTQRLAQQAQLLRNSRHFSAYFNNSPIGMAAASPDKTWLEVNDRLCNMLGYSAEQLIHTTWLALTHPDDVATDVALFDQLLSGKHDSYQQEKRFICKDGSVLHTHLAVRCVADPRGQLEYVVAAIQDIQDRKNAELELLLREKLLQEQTCKLHQRVNELAAVYAISRATQHALTEAEFFAEVFANLPSGLIYPEDACVQIVVAGVTHTSLNYQQPLHKISASIHVHGTKQGELNLGYLRQHPQADAEPFCGEERLLVRGVADLIGRFIEGVQDKLARDLTAKRNSALLELTTESTGMTDEDLVRYALDQAEKMTSSSMAYCHFVNDDQETITLGTWSTATLTHCEASFDNHYPISKAGVWADCFRQRKSIIHNDYAALTDKKGLPEGHVTVLRHVGVPVFLGNKVVLIFGVGNKGSDYDAGDLALTEVLANNLWVLLQRNRSLRKLKLDAEVFRLSREAVVITDATGSIVSVNQAFTEITGYSAAEVIGRNPRMLQSGKHDAAFFKKLWEQILQAGHWQGEIWNRRKNGEIYPEWLGITMTKNSANEVSEYIGIFMDITEHKKAQACIEQLGYYDPLTSLANRRLLNDRTRQAIGQAQRQAHMLGLIYLDLDHFKDINDSLGHLVGDELLRLVSVRLLSCVRDTDTVCRMGGDEFVVLLTRVASPDNVADACSKILLALSDVFELKQHTLRVSASMGASIYPDDGQNFDDLLQHADTAMYQAKAAGRGNFKLFTEAMNRRVQHRLRLQSQMKKSLAANEFYLQYQPQFDLQQQQIIGVEALARWQHPVIGNITPGEFIPVAEESDLIVAIGNFVMREACLQAKRWLDAGYRIGMAVNVSYVQFARHNLLRTVMDVLQETQLPPELLELELTESILISDPEKVLLVVDQLASMGVTFSIDDFGTGYSSLSYLKRFSVHKLKIDQSFVRDLLTDPSDAVIVSAIINMAHNLQMQSIAEGVETREQAIRLGELGCQQIQGYWFSKPLSALQMDALLASMPAEERLEFQYEHDQYKHRLDAPV